MAIVLALSKSEQNILVLNMAKLSDKFHFFKYIHVCTVGILNIKLLESALSSL